MDLEIKSLLDAQGQALDQAMEKFEGQLAESGKVSVEAKAEVKAEPKTPAEKTNNPTPRLDQRTKNSLPLSNLLWWGTGSMPHWTEFLMKFILLDFLF